MSDQPINSPVPLNFTQEDADKLHAEAFPFAVYDMGALEIVSVWENKDLADAEALKMSTQFVSTVISRAESNIGWIKNAFAAWDEYRHNVDLNKN